jgi:hypothetical protein
MVTSDVIPVSRLSATLRDKTGNPGPGHRKLVQLAADAQIAPPMEQRGQYWVCPASKVPELAMLLGLLPDTAASIEQRPRAGARQGCTHGPGAVQQQGNA